MFLCSALATLTPKLSFTSVVSSMLYSKPSLTVSMERMILPLYFKKRFTSFTGASSGGVVAILWPKRPSHPFFFARKKVSAFSLCTCAASGLINGISANRRKNIYRLLLTINFWQALYLINGLKILKTEKQYTNSLSAKDYLHYKTEMGCK